jgi:flavorubredoxin
MPQACRFDLEYLGLSGSRHSRSGRLIGFTGKIRVKRYDAADNFVSPKEVFMTNVTEIAPDIYRISTFIPEIDLGFSQFLVNDDEPLLFHTGMRAIFPLVHEAVGRIIDPSKLRWIGFSHFEADECGALNEWRQIAPNSEAVCSFVGKVVSVDDFLGDNSTKGMADNEMFETGKHRFRFLQTPHVPHCWEAGMLFEETNGVLFCTDLFHQTGDVEPLTTSDVVGRAREALVEGQKGPLANYFPYTRNTEAELKRLASLKPRVLATMHGSVFEGDGERAMLDYAEMLKQELDR